MGTEVSVMMWLWRADGVGEDEGEVCVEEEVELEEEEGVKEESSGEISYSYWWAAKHFGVGEDGIVEDVSPVSMDCGGTVMVYSSLSWVFWNFSNVY